MIKGVKALCMFIGMLGVVRIFSSMVANSPSEISRLWFIGAGFAILLAGLLGIAALRRLEREKVTSNIWHMTNSAATAFVASMR